MQLTIFFFQKKNHWVLQPRYHILSVSDPAMASSSSVGPRTKLGVTAENAECESSENNTHLNDVRRRLRRKYTVARLAVWLYGPVTLAMDAFAIFVAIRHRHLLDTPGLLYAMISFPVLLIPEQILSMRILLKISLKAKALRDQTIGFNDDIYMHGAAPNTDPRLSVTLTPSPSISSLPIYAIAANAPMTKITSI
jgi:hypothetical protein